MYQMFDDDCEIVMQELTDEEIEELNADPWPEQVRLALARFLSQGATIFVDDVDEANANTGPTNTSRWHYIHETLDLGTEIDLLWTAEMWSQAFQAAYDFCRDPKALLAYHWIAELRAEFFYTIGVVGSEIGDYEYHVSYCWARKLFDLHVAISENGGVPEGQEIRHDWIH